MSAAEPPPEPPAVAEPINPVPRNNRKAKTAASWRPGTSGNPRGSNQHSKVKTFRQLMEEELNRIVPKDNQVPPKNETNKAALVRQAVLQARKGNLTALMWLVERVEGKVPDHVVQDVRSAIVMVPWNDEDADVEYVPRPDIDHVLALPGEPPPRRRHGRVTGPPDEAIRDTFEAEQRAKAPDSPEGSQGHTSEG
jgi:Family of unknown function (DUF5681)